MAVFSGLKVKKLFRAIEKYPDIFKNYKTLIELLFDRGDDARAMEVLEKALTRQWDPTTTTWLRVQDFRAKHRRGALDVQPRTLLDLIQSSGMTPDLKLETATILCEQLLGNKDVSSDSGMSELTAQVQKILEKIPVSKSEQQLHVGVLRARLAEMADDFSSALEYMEETLATAQRSRVRKLGLHYIHAAELAQKCGKSADLVMKYLKQALDSGELTEPQTVDVLTRMGALLESSDDLLGAMEKYETALRFSSGSSGSEQPVIRFKLAKLYRRLGRIPQAQKEAGLALESRAVGNDFRARIILWQADIEKSREQFSAALELVHTALEHAEDTDLKVELLLFAGNVAMQCSRFDDSVECFSQALEICPPEQKNQLQFHLARALIPAGKAHRSLKLLRDLKKELPAPGVELTAVLLEEGRAFLARKNVISALTTFLEVFETASESDARGKEAQEEIFRLKRELSKPEGLKKYKVDGSDRKHLAALLARSPDEDDFFTRLKKGLSKTKSGLIGGIEKILSGRTKIDEEVLDDLEEVLILSDMGVDTTRKIMDGLHEKLRKSQLSDADVVRQHIRTEIETILKDAGGELTQDPEQKPFIIMVVGVNGVGKTTTIAKIAKRYTDNGKSVLLAAGDTFRAGAIEQLQEWGKRLDLEVVAQGEGSDPSAVAWDAVAAAKNRAVDVLIVDTAGRLHTKSNLMEELKKVNRTISKNMPGAPHEVLLVLDATTGQNAITQARIFNEAVNLTGIVLTKLDGTAKGGIIIGIVQALNIPVKLIGIGERMDDLRDFDAQAFSAALFEE